MSTDEAAELAIRDKSPRLDGRRCNVNLAYIGQKKKNIGLTSKFSLLLSLMRYLYVSQMDIFGPDQSYNFYPNSALIIYTNVFLEGP